MDTSPSSFETVALIKRLAALTHQAIDVMLKPHGLARTQYAALYVIAARSRVSSGELAELLFVEPATLSGVVETLRSKKLVATQDDIYDKRRKYLVLTPKGAELFATIQAPQPVVEQILAKHLATDEFDTLKRNLKEMIKNLENENKKREGGRNVAKD